MVRFWKLQIIFCTGVPLRGRYGRPCESITCNWISLLSLSSSGWNIIGGPGSCRVFCFHGVTVFYNYLVGFVEALEQVNFSRNVGFIATSASICKEFRLGYCINAIVPSFAYPSRSSFGCLEASSVRFVFCCILMGQ